MFEQGIYSKAGKKMELAKFRDTFYPDVDDGGNDDDDDSSFDGNFSPPSSLTLDNKKITLLERKNFEGWCCSKTCRTAGAKVD